MKERELTDLEWHLLTEMSLEYIKLMAGEAGASLSFTKASLAFNKKLVSNILK